MASKKAESAKKQESARSDHAPPPPPDRQQQSDRWTAAVGTTGRFWTFVGAVGLWLVLQWVRIATFPLSGAGACDELLDKLVTPRQIGELFVTCALGILIVGRKKKFARVHLSAVLVLTAGCALVSYILYANLAERGGLHAEAGDIAFEYLLGRMSLVAIAVGLWVGRAIGTGKDS